MTRARTSLTHEHNSPWLPLFSPGWRPIRPQLSPSPQETKLWCMGQYPLLSTHYVALSPGGGRVEIQQDSL